MGKIMVDEAYLQYLEELAKELKEVKEHMTELVMCDFLKAVTSKSYGFALDEMLKDTGNPAIKNFFLAAEAFFAPYGKKNVGESVEITDSIEGYRCPLKSGQYTVSSTGWRIGKKKVVGPILK